MLANPDIQPIASIDHWIVSILIFHFNLVHVAGIFHGPDGLSRHPRQPDNELEPDNNNFDNWIDNLNGFMHQINNVTLHTNRVSKANNVATYTLSQEQSKRDMAKSVEPPPVDLVYDDIPRSPAAICDNEKLPKVLKWLKDLTRPPGLTNNEYSTFLCYYLKFFLDNNRLWRKDSQGAHKLVLAPEKRMEVMSSIHEHIGHKGFFAMCAAISERFWWPFMPADIIWFVRSCHMCQLWQIRQVLIPPIVATPAPLFIKAYMDTMHMPPSNSFKYIVQAHCSLIRYPEFRALRSETACAIGNWVYQDILCQWGSLRKIVTDNSVPFVNALTYLSK